MFSFQVTIKGEERTGSIVSGPIHFELGAEVGVYVVVMWDDDYTFSTVKVEDLQAMAREAPENVVKFPGGGIPDVH